MQMQLKSEYQLQKIKTNKQLFNNVLVWTMFEVFVLICCLVCFCICWCSFLLWLFQSLIFLLLIFICAYVCFDDSNPFCESSHVSCSMFICSYVRVHVLGSKIFRASIVYRISFSFVQYLFGGFDVVDD
jgi:hypothetical protein